MSPIEHAILLNNEGVCQSIADGCDTEKAVMDFSKAVRLFTTMVSMDAANGNSPAASYLHERKTTLPGFGQKESTLSNTLITFDTSTSNFNANDCRIFCAASLLNIAIVSHRRALSGNEELFKIEKLYQRVLDVLPVGTAEQNGTGIMVKLMAMNNLSQLRKQRGATQHKAATEVLQLLFAQLVTASPATSNADGNNNVLFSTEEFKSMLSNVGMVAAPKQPKVSPKAPQHGSRLRV